VRGLPRCSVRSGCGWWTGILRGSICGPWGGRRSGKRRPAGLLWEGKVERVIPECEEVLGRRSGWSAEVAQTAEYFRERRVQMESPAFRKAGYPIGSGTVESACTGIGWRCKGRGQHCKAKGGVAI
jgi:hypothetical protein